MQVEYEATFTNVNKDEVRTKLKAANAVLVKPEFLQKRVVFDFPIGHEIKGGWLRIRDEQDKVTMSLKIVSDTKKITDQKEICLIIDNYQQAVEFLETIGCQLRSYQETKREIWHLSQVEVCIDEWPFLEPYVEIEGKSEAVVKEVSRQLGFDYRLAKFCAADSLYQDKYGLSLDAINCIAELKFDIKNPFLKLIKK
ncbi:MAG: CYTH domain-containing protein [Candidatus Buchananbacteria bacterium]|nr:CYTH domain-containing protein [Candidatus Buchananbacteria bacterium]